MERPAGMIVFGPGCGRRLAEAVASLLGAEFADVDVTRFDDGERRIRPSLEVGGHDVVVLQSLVSLPGESVHDGLVQLLFLLATLRDHGAARLTAVVPYLCYSRQDRPVHPRDPVATSHVARLFEAVGVDRVVTVDVHNPSAFANAYRVPTANLDTTGVLADAVVDELVPDEPVVVVSPDAGSVKRAENHRLELGRRLRSDVPDAFVEKHRADHVNADHAVVGDVAGHTAVIIDDMIATGATLVRAAQACVEHGATRVVAAATHGVFAGAADEVLAADKAVDRIVVTDTIEPLRISDPSVLARVSVRSVARLVAGAISSPAGRAVGA